MLGSIPASTAELYKLFFITLDNTTSFLFNFKTFLVILNSSLFLLISTEVIASIG